MGILKSGDDGFLLQIEDWYLALISSQHCVELALTEVEQDRVEFELKWEILSLFVDIAEQIFIVGVGYAYKVMQILHHQRWALANADLHPLQKHLRFSVINVSFILDVEENSIAVGEESVRFSLTDYEWFLCLHDLWDFDYFFGQTEDLIAAACHYRLYLVLKRDELEFRIEGIKHLNWISS